MLWCGDSQAMPGLSHAADLACRPATGRASSWASLELTCVQLDTEGSFTE